MSKRGTSQIWTVGVFLAICSALYVTGGRFLGSAGNAETDDAAADLPAAELPPAPLGDPQPFRGLDAYVDARIDSVLATSPSWRSVAETPKGEASSRAEDQLRAALRSALPPAPNRGDVRRSARRTWIERDGVSIDQVHIETPWGGVLPAAVLTPTGTGGSALPAVLALHGERASWPSLLLDVDYHHGFAHALARRGFVVLAPLRALGNGRERYHIDAKAKLTGLSAHAVALWEVEAAFDYLAGEPGVDPGRIGVYGISNGGELALRFGALDARPAALVVSNYVADRRTWTFDTAIPMRYGTHMSLLEEGAVLLDDANLAALIRPRPLAIVVGVGDARHEQTVGVFEDFLRLYRAVDAEDDLRLIQTQAGHEIVVDSVVPFLKRHLAPVGSH